MRKSFLFCLCFILIGANCQESKEAEDEKQSEDLAGAENNATDPDPERTKKMFSFLQVMKFPNDVCVGTASRNGTCYSSDECTSKGGTASGNCANGFGVCCVFLLGCGQTSSENNTFLVLSATTTPSPSVCTYTLCEGNAAVCRIRLDFTTFSINGPQTVAVSAVGTAASETGHGGAVGDCTSDSFTLTSPQNRGSPAICGLNTGSHMYIDTTNGNCAKATFDFGNAAVSRSYDIKVTQYNCGDEMAGPPDCLQYFTGNTGTFTSFNFVLTSGAVAATSTHLSSQNYNICFRRNSGKCAICYIATITATGTVGASFGLSISSAAGIVQAAQDTLCNADYLVIPNGQAPTAVTQTTNTASRFCGRFLTSIANSIANASVCSGQRPFKVSFVTDANEVDLLVTASMANQNEFMGLPAGIIGFSLDFAQQACV